MLYDYVTCDCDLCDHHITSHYLNKENKKMKTKIK